VLDASHLTDLVNTAELSSADRVLLCLAVEVENAKSVKEIIEIGYGGGFRKIKKLVTLQPSEVGVG
jgi:hypothetical protein